MQSGLLGTFETALDELDVDHDRTDPGALGAAIEAAVVEPAVGAPLPWDEGVLADAGVNCRPTSADLRVAETGITAAGAAIADEGTLVVQSRPGGDEPVSLYPPRHVAVVRASDVLPDVPTALDWLAGEFGAGRTSAVFATGPSATADMGELVTGVHGPGEVHVITVMDA